MTKSQAREAAEELLGQMGLRGILHCYPSEISSGMRRRVEIARAMINNPRVLLMDEPYRAMDALTKTVMHKHLLDIYDASCKTVFFITHDLEEAIFLGSKVYVMTTRPEKSRNSSMWTFPDREEIFGLSVRALQGVEARGD